MKEEELIGKVKQLRQIKPNQEWVLFTKTQILGEETRFNLLSYFLKPAFATAIAVFLLFSICGYNFVKNALPGDVLYALRKAVHEGQAVLLSETQKPAYQLKLANDRLEDLAKAGAKNLAPTIKEFKANITEAARTLSNMDATTSDPVMMRQIVEQTKKLEENKQKVESLGMVIGETEQLETALAKVAENLISDLENRTLSQAKTNILAEMKELCAEKKYSEALELYLVNQ